MSPTRLGEVESNPLFLGADSATFDAPGAATVLGRDPDMGRYLPTALVLPPQPKVRDRTLIRRRAAYLKNVHIRIYV